MVSKELYDFLKYWAEKTKKGETSSLTGLEILLLEIYDQWLRDNKRL